jgi:hypothetical protein
MAHAHCACTCERSVLTFFTLYSVEGRAGGTGRALAARRVSLVLGWVCNLLSAGRTYYYLLLRRPVCLRIAACCTCTISHLPSPLPLPAYLSVRSRSVRTFAASSGPSRRSASRTAATRGTRRLPACLPGRARQAAGARGRPARRGKRQARGGHRTSLLCAL